MSVFPAARLRRFRRTGALRELVRETRLDLRDFVYPLFACSGSGVAKPLEGLPGIVQRSVDRLADEAEELERLGVGAVLLFGIPEEKDEAALDIDLARVAWRRADDSFFEVFASQFVPGASFIVGELRLLRRADHPLGLEQPGGADLVELRGQLVT